MSKVKVKENRKEFDKLVKRLIEAKSKIAKVGILETEANNRYDDSLKTIEVASFHEFGTEDIPQRSFIRQAVEANKATLNEALNRGYQELIMRDISPDAVIERLGMLLHKFVIQQFEQGGQPKWKELSENTKAAKGSSKPLVDTGQLRQSISWAVSVRQSEWRARLTSESSNTSFMPRSNE